MSDVPFFPAGRLLAGGDPCVESTFVFVCFLGAGQAVNTKQRTLHDQSWVEVADIVHSVVLHKPPTLRIFASSSPPSKIRSSIMHWPIRAFCEPSFSQHAQRHHPTSARAGERKIIPICFPLCIYLSTNACLVRLS